jgi:solute carrier family 12 sodium/potassium/chloride transporter 2
VVKDEAAAESATNNLKTMVAQLRIGAKSHVIVANGRSFDDILHESSVGADLVFLGMAKPRENFNFTEYYQTIQARAVGLPSTVFVLAAPDFAFEEVLTDPTSGSKGV